MLNLRSVSRGLGCLLLIKTELRHIKNVQNIWTYLGNLFGNMTSSWFGEYKCNKFLYFIIWKLFALFKEQTLFVPLRLLEVRKSHNQLRFVSTQFLGKQFFPKHLKWKSRFQKLLAPECRACQLQRKRNMTLNSVESIRALRINVFYCRVPNTTPKCFKNLKNSKTKPM